MLAPGWRIVVWRCVVSLAVGALAWRSAAAPLADNFGAATPLSGITNVVGSNFLASAELFEPPHAGESATHSVWAIWTAPVTGSYSISTSNSTFDTVLGIYTGDSLSSLTLVATNDDADLFIAWSRVVFRAYAGEKFHIAVDGSSGATGVIQLRIAPGGPPMASWATSDPSGRPVSSLDFSNNLLMIDFWETICGACVEELPDLERVYTSLHPRGLAIVGLAMDLDPRVVLDYVADREIPYPIAMASKSATSAFGGPQAAPTKYLVDQERKIVARLQGGNVENFYRGIIDPLLRLSSLVRLQLARDRASVTLCWPATASGYRLETAGSPGAATWNEVGAVVLTNNGQYLVTIPVEDAPRYFRLKKP